MTTPRALVLCLVCASCATVPVSAPSTSWGSAMSEVGRRFELVGLAVEAGRFELAAYEQGELEEVFGETLPQASLPKEGHPEALPPLRAQFLASGLKGLEAGLKTRKVDAARQAFAATAKECNACHLASGHAFIEVPETAGARVPRVDAVPSP